MRLRLHIAGPKLSAADVARFTGRPLPAAAAEPDAVRRAEVRAYAAFTRKAVRLRERLQRLARAGFADPADLALLAAFDRWAAGDLT